MTANGDCNGDMKTISPCEDASDLINKDLFVDVLEKQFAKCTLKKFESVKSSEGCENYMSLMFRVNIDMEKEDGTPTTAKFIVKVMPPNDPSAEFKKNLQVYSKEVEMYTKVIPKFQEIFHENNIEVEFAPKFWKTVEEHEILIMEDLKARKFENINRIQGMDMQHAELVLGKIAQFHAASACIYERDGKYSPQLMDETLREAKEEGFRKIQPILWAMICSHFRQWHSCQEYVEMMEGLKDRIADVYIEAFKRDSNEFNVLLHGDLWANNIMFQHDDNGKAKEVLFVDLQISRYGSPAHDLIYFIVSSTENSIKTKEFDHFIKFYHTELVKNLKLLKYPKPIPKLIDLHIAVLKRCFLGIATSVGAMAAALQDPNDNADISFFMAQSEEAKQFRKNFYMNPRLIRACELTLPFFCNKEISEVPTVVHLHSGIPVVIHMMRRERINEDSSALPTRIIQFTTK
ncbi:uncharacterized protein LOC119658735 isoform X3 [Hermetia illucens]|nr:uncharacterized protein LOC119658735 isoform X3 [Hermetia illucens]XP_037922331.1 uncharacterized protein LOC119658735 isoform X3 [Hermetia illucens]XP_037922332.1 uncharacterized protein LOC119658735 isoform X3 [Hermetia illucens]XP_037922333.1 uncharacterized protein LOC119658735 isoform X3 [Hermetia illucens]